MPSASSNLLSTSVATNRSSDLIADAIDRCPVNHDHGFSTRPSPSEHCLGGHCCLEYIASKALLQ